MGWGALFADKWAHYSTRPDLGVVICGTVAFSALQFALAAGTARGSIGRYRPYEISTSPE